MTMVDLGQVCDLIIILTKFASLPTATDEVEWPISKSYSEQEWKKFTVK